MWPSKIPSDQRENEVASAPGCFSHLHPVWLATFNLLIQYLVTLFRDSSEHSLAQGGDLNSVLTNFTHGPGKSPKPSAKPSWLFMFLPSSPLPDLLMVYSWAQFPQFLLQLTSLRTDCDFISVPDTFLNLIKLQFSLFRRVILCPVAFLCLSLIH